MVNRKVYWSWPGEVSQTVIIYSKKGTKECQKTRLELELLAVEHNAGEGVRLVDFR